MPEFFDQEPVLYAQRTLRMVAFEPDTQKVFKVLLPHLSVNNMYVQNIDGSWGVCLIPSSNTKP